MIRALHALALGWADLLRPATLRLILVGMALTIVLFIGLQAAIFWALRLMVPGGFALPWLGEVQIGPVLSWGSLALFPLMGIFLMAPVAALFSGLFAENVAAEVERRHYPDRQGVSLDFMDSLLESLAVMAAVLGIGIVALLLTPFLGPLVPVLFYTANGWLLGREFFQMAARRHLSEPEARRLRQRHSGAILITGALVAVGLTVPLLNIALPLLAASAFTHLYHKVSGSAGPVARYPNG